MGVASSATFGPLIADTSLWFTRHRGMAVAIIASGSYLAGTVWPPVVQHFIQSAGWRRTYLGIAVFCVATMLPLALALRRRSPLTETSSATSRVGVAVVAAAGDVAGRAADRADHRRRELLRRDVDAAGPHRGVLRRSGPRRGAGRADAVADAGLRHREPPGLGLHLRSDRRPAHAADGLGLQALALVLFLPFHGLTALYVVSALFGLFQGGIVPAYAVIVREFFPPEEAGVRVSTVLMATVFGMALGGWMSGVIFDLTGSYQAAFLNGILWNLLNIGIAVGLLRRPGEAARAHAERLGLASDAQRDAMRRRCSGIMQRSCTTRMPARASCSAAASLRMPS